MKNLIVEETPTIVESLLKTGSRLNNTVKKGIPNDAKLSRACIDEHENLKLSFKCESLDGDDENISIVVVYQ